LLVGETSIEPLPADVAKALGPIDIAPSAAKPRIETKRFIIASPMFSG
jgi:hypothetical protein